MVYKTAFLLHWKWIPHNERKPATEITGRHQLLHRTEGDAFIFLRT